MNESILTPPPQPPSVAEETSVRLAQRDTIAAYFRVYVNQDLLPEKLESVVGPNYRSRIAECRTELGMHIENVPRYRNIDAKTKRGKPMRVRLRGAYRFTNYEPVARDAGHPPTAGQLEMWK